MYSANGRPILAGLARARLQAGADVDQDGVEDAEVRPGVLGVDDQWRDGHHKVRAAGDGPFVSVVARRRPSPTTSASAAA